MTLQSRLQNDLTDAIRDRDELRRDTLRMVVSAAYNAEKQARRELTDDEVVHGPDPRGQVAQRVGRGLHRRRPARAAAEEQAEIGVIREFLPRAARRRQLAAIVAPAIAESGATSAPRHGQGHGACSAPRTRGRADGRAVVMRRWWPPSSPARLAAQPRNQHDCPLRVWSGAAFTRRDARAPRRDRALILVAAGTADPVLRPAAGRSAFQASSGGRCHGRRPRASRHRVHQPDRGHPGAAATTASQQVAPQYDYTPSGRTASSPTSRRAPSDGGRPGRRRFAGRSSTPDAAPGRAGGGDPVAEQRQHAATLLSLDSVDSWTALRAADDARPSSEAQAAEVRDTRPARRPRRPGPAPRPRASRPISARSRAEILSPLAGGRFRPTTRRHQRRPGRPPRQPGRAGRMLVAKGELVVAGQPIDDPPTSRS